MGVSRPNMEGSGNIPLPIGPRTRHVWSDHTGNNAGGRGRARPADARPPGAGGVARSGPPLARSRARLEIEAGAGVGDRRRVPPGGVRGGRGGGRRRRCDRGRRRGRCRFALTPRMFTSSTAMSHGADPWSRPTDGSRLDRCDTHGHGASCCPGRPTLSRSRVQLTPSVVSSSCSRAHACSGRTCRYRSAPRDARRRSATASVYGPTLGCHL